MLNLFQKQFLSAQEFADKTYYLVDSLILKQLLDSDKEIVENSLKKYHQAKEDTSKINALNSIVEESLDDRLWTKYNLWVYNFAQEELNNIFFNWKGDEEQVDDVCIIGVRI